MFFAADFDEGDPSQIQPLPTDEAQGGPTQAAGPQRGQGGVHRHGRDVYGAVRGIPRLLHPQPA